MTDIAGQRDCDIYENAAASSTDDNATFAASPPLKTENEKIEVGVATSEALDLDYPDGGLAAWLTVLGGVCITTATFGFVNSYVCFCWPPKIMICERVFSGRMWHLSFNLDSLSSTMIL